MKLTQINVALRGALYLKHRPRKFSLHWSPKVTRLFLRKVHYDRFSRSWDASFSGTISASRRTADVWRGALVTMSYYGAEKSIGRYGAMACVRTALESAVRYWAQKLGPKGICGRAKSLAPVKMRGPCGIDHFDELFERAAGRGCEAVGHYRGWRAGHSRPRNGYAELIYVDGGC